MPRTLKCMTDMTEHFKVHLLYVIIRALHCSASHVGTQNLQYTIIIATPIYTFRKIWNRIRSIFHLQCCYSITTFQCKLKIIQMYLKLSWTMLNAIRQCCQTSGMNGEQKLLNELLSILSFTITIVDLDMV